MLHLPKEHGNSVEVILGGTGGPPVTIDANGRIDVASSPGPGDSEVRKAVSSIFQDIKEISRLASDAKAANAGAH